MKVRDNIVGVVDKDIHRGRSHKDAAQASDHKGGDKSKRENHRCGKPNGAAPKGAEPIKGLNGRRNRDDHRSHHEGSAQDWIHSAEKHMVTPDDPGEEGNGDHGEGHGPVAKDRFAAEHRQNLGGNPHGRQDQNVDFWMTKKPEKVLPEQRITTAFRQEETGSECPVEEKHRQGSHQNGEGQQG